MMKVKELVGELLRVDGEAMVVIRGYESGVDEATWVKKRVLALNVYDKWYYGTHEIVSEPYNTKELEEFGKCDAIQIG